MVKDIDQCYNESTTFSNPSPQRRQDSGADIRFSSRESDIENESALDSGDEKESDHAFLRNQGTETGQIRRVHVENFMCHRKLTVEFGKHVNFVTGQNGSGNFFSILPTINGS